jgi:hypothetical protein
VCLSLANLKVDEVLKDLAFALGQMYSNAMPFVPEVAVVTIEPHDIVLLVTLGLFLVLYDVEEVGVDLGPWSCSRVSQRQKMPSRARSGVLPRAPCFVWWHMLRPAQLTSRMFSRIAFALAYALRLASMMFKMLMISLDRESRPCSWFPLGV